MGTINEGILLGDSGYPLIKYILTPYLHPETRSQRNYYASHIRTRNCVKRFIGILKRRFPVLSVELRTKLLTTLTIIVETALLHNIAVETKKHIPPEDLTLHQYMRNRRQNRNVRIQNQIRIHVDNEHTSKGYRNAITQQHFACKYILINLLYYL